MSSYFKGQSITIKLDTNVDLSTASAMSIRYEDPDGTKGEYTGLTYEGVNNSVIGKSIASITKAGQWRFQAAATFGSLTYLGEIVELIFKESIEVS